MSPAGCAVSSFILLRWIRRADGCELIWSDSKEVRLKRNVFSAEHHFARKIALPVRFAGNI
jgi:hypothetical protein